MADFAVNNYKQLRRVSRDLRVVSRPLTRDRLKGVTPFPNRCGGGVTKMDKFGDKVLYNSSATRLELTLYRNVADINHAVF